MTSDVYRYWRAALKGAPDPSLMVEIGPKCIEGWPQPGLWKVCIKGGYIDGVKQAKVFAPMQIWAHDANGTVIHMMQDGLSIGGLIDGEPVSVDQILARWPGVEPLSKKDRDYYIANSKTWPWDTPDSALVDTLGRAKPAPEKPAAADETMLPAASNPGPGHNSGDAESFETMRAQILGEVAEASNYFKRHPVTDKASADKCENWRKKIDGLGKLADARRKAENKPLDDQIAENNLKWNTLVTAAKTEAAALKASGDAWILAEQNRLRQIALNQARVAHEAAEKKRAEELAQQRAARDKAEAERERMAEDDPIAFFTGSAPELPPEPEPPAELPFTPVVAVENIMIGTTGNRRSAKTASGTPVIADIKAAALYYAEQQNPDLVALIQKLANKAAKANASVPGITMPWQMQTEKDTAA